MNKWTKKLISYAERQIENWKAAGAKVADDQMAFNENLINGLCPTCKCKLRVVEYQEDKSSYKYSFECGHNLIGISLNEKINIKDSVKLKQMREGFGLVKRSFHGYKPSGDIKLSEGITMDMVVDRENHEYHQRVVDNKTGKVIHEEHESLIEHSKKQESSRKKLK